MDRRIDLTMFAGYHAGWMAKNSGAGVNMKDLNEMIGEFMEFVQPISPDEKELQATFELRWQADQRAIKMWRADHPNSGIDWPDHADMVVWLLEQLDDENSP